ncbi:cytochrome c oxidase subunit 6C-like [Amyelois transitella]|uniref:cytochrome c oxidase subunit 6C-like n=1 Tax=Amyelois transitella TaxID=680683 RepID=UPI00298FCAFB|nr:cytochrome c oxidase subunit 6C-like [Amyelois transitella]XP_060809787.1 cytochrome c oxidase subunit 6C-like [Amyelois transitella]
MSGYPSCPPPAGPVCPQICPPPDPAPPCRVKPIMRGLHWSQTTKILTQAFALAALGGASVYVFVARPRRARYQEFHAKAEIEDWADEMARKGLFQSVPLSSFTDDSDKKSK